MSTQTSRLPGEAPSNQAAFSYAQAAKGRATSNTNTTIQSSQTTSGANTPAKDATSAAVSVNGSTAEVAEHIANGTHDLGKGENISAVRSDSSESRLTAANTAPTSPSVGSASASTIPKEDGLNLANSTGGESGWDKSVPASGGMDKHSEAGDGKKGRKGKKSKNAEKESEKEKVEEPKVYVPAAPPAVNFWQQRQEAQAAKAKASPVVDSSQSFDVVDPSAGLKKKSGKPTDEAASNSGPREASNTIKTQKKGSDGLRGKDEIANKRPPRGSRIGDKDEKAVHLPPPVEDATSWPTPETALEEGKRKAQEKSEKDEKDKENSDNASSKPRPKEKWVHVPYIPTVTFNTPIPPRGGRGRGGGRGGRDSSGRGGHAANGSIVGEKASNASGAQESKERGREAATNGRANSLPPNSSKRPSSNGPYGAREQRKSLATAPNGQRSGTTSTTKADATSAENRNPSTVVQAENAQNDQDASRADNLKGAKPEQVQAVNGEGHAHVRSASDRRSEPNLRGADQFRDGANFTKEGGHQSRDRTEGRSDRGRGNFRGRGGHNNFTNGHNFANGHGSQSGGAYQTRQNSGPYSPPLQQPPFQNSFTQGSSRSGRSGGRSQSIPNGSMYSRYPPNGNTGSQMTPLQTSGPVFDYQPMAHMSAIPYNPFIEQYSVLAMVTMQLEYYFSIDNLCKDVFLRKHMDSQGFVFLSFIAGFKRIQALTQDFELLRYACQESELIDIIKGEDGVDRLRRQEGWEKWVLGMEDRDESVRNAGPTQHFRQPSQRSQSMGQLMLPGQHIMPPQAFSPNGTGPYGNGLAVAPAAGANGHAYPADIPLSAAVPDFAPGYQPANSSPDPLDAETTFTDEEVDNLTLVFASAKASGDSKQVPYHNASARTFSNGSIDGRSIEGMIEELRQGRPLTNGSHSSEHSPEQSRKPEGGNPPPVMWVKGQKQQVLVSEHNTEESYTAVRARALKHREVSGPDETHPDMKLLYEFWAHFLCRNFNPKMYYEFRAYAFEDAAQNKSVGMENLITYYDEILNSKKKTIPEPLARHYVELVKGEESSSKRPGFDKLRAAWRNGALDLKSRKKIDSLVDAKLRAELER
ncbi:hypothetical protein F5884DRAFT_369579 [Xylogone sp. PMI_703]|nr:hypothetical protein F5884DRAFT_369579 [Xylogone sp. PMI_703]